VKVVTITRKPFRGAAFQSCLDHGCGAFNIDATRVGEGGPDGGRFPANAIFQHHPQCQRLGSKRTSGYTINRWSDGAKPFGGGAGHQYDSSTASEGKTEVRGCHEDCSLEDLGSQSGTTKFTYTPPRKKASPFNSATTWETEGRSLKDGVATAPLNYGDEGTAAIYFKQFQGETVNELPDDLINYLHTLINPPEGRVLVALDLSSVDWSSHEDSSLHGLVTLGDPGEAMEEVWRVLKPGAHVVSIGTDEEPTNHTAACALQDQGFEIRDSILLVQEPGRIHYVKKCSPNERHAGVPVNADGKRNFHNTVKPKGIMLRLMGDLPEGAHIVDPFMGSGSTGIACVEAGYSFTGMDLDMSHVELSETRITFWEAKEFRSWGAQVESDSPEQAVKKPRGKVSFLKLRDI